MTDQKTLRYSGGTGTASDPYRIECVYDWRLIAASPGDWGCCFVLVRNLSLLGHAMVLTSIGSRDVPFTGVLDGGGYLVADAVIGGANKDYVGLFGVVGAGGVLLNLGVENVIVSGRHYVGGLIGSNDGSITACSAIGEVSGRYYVGGLVGVNCGSLTGCRASSAVSGIEYVGRLAGYSFGGSITSCRATGAVNGNKDVGGLIGGSFSSAITA